MIPLKKDKDELRQLFVERTGLGSSKYQITRRSPWPSELFSLFAIGNDRGVVEWVESGTYHGQSASVLTKASGIPITTIEADPHTADIAIKRFTEEQLHVGVVVGNGTEVLPQLIQACIKPTGVFLDGPKGLKAAVLAAHLLNNYSHVKFVGVHDMCKSVEGRPVVGRAALEDIGKWSSDFSFWATDDEEYVEWAKSMDDELYAYHTTENNYGWHPYEHFAPGKTLKMRSYGPTIAFLLRG